MLIKNGIRSLKINILVTQRIEHNQFYDETRDCLDHNWIIILKELFGNKVNIYPLPNKTKNISWWISSLKINLIILTGGNSIGEIDWKDNLELDLIKIAEKEKLPIFGVCRGMQLLNYYFGNNISKLNNHIGINHIIFPLKETKINKPLLVNSFHQFGILEKDLNKKFKPLYLHHDGSVESFVNKDLKWLALMWHPERYSPDTKKTKLWLKNTIIKYLK